VKAFFVKESQTRAQYANELEFAAALKREEGGTAAGAMHRFWGDLKGKLGGGDHTLLETAEQGEDTAKEAYQKRPRRMQSLSLCARFCSHNKVTSGNLAIQ
jgi:uncharacterized protein (TIGR02284 family)